MKTISFVFLLSVAAALEIQTQVLPNLATNIFGLKNDWHSPFPVGRRGVPVCCGFRIDSKGRMRLRGVRYERLNEHLADTAAMFFD